jgi:anti-sigma regulatory factor (Ser/Thr protein kinase)
MSASSSAFPGVPESAKAARQFTARALTAAGVPQGDIDTAVLCVSELVTNAVRHSLSGTGGGKVRLSLTIQPGQWVLIECHDDGPLEPGRSPGLARPAADDENGRGLVLVEHFSGGTCGADGKGTAWCRIPWTAVLTPAVVPADAGALW